MIWLILSAITGIILSLLVTESAVNCLDDPTADTLSTC